MAEPAEEGRLKKGNSYTLELALHTVHTMTGEAIDFVTWEKQSRQD